MIAQVHLLDRTSVTVTDPNQINNVIEGFKAKDQTQQKVIMVNIGGRDEVYFNADLITSIQVGEEVDNLSSSQEG